MICGYCGYTGYTFWLRCLVDSVPVARLHTHVVRGYRWLPHRLHWTCGYYTAHGLQFVSFVLRLFRTPCAVLLPGSTVGLPLFFAFRSRLPVVRVTRTWFGSTRLHCGSCRAFWTLHDYVTYTLPTYARVLPTRFTFTTVVTARCVLYAVAVAYGCCRLRMVLRSCLYLGCGCGSGLRGSHCSLHRAPHRRLVLYGSAVARLRTRSPACAHGYITFRLLRAARLTPATHVYGYATAHCLRLHTGLPALRAVLRSSCLLFLWLRYTHTATRVAFVYTRFCHGCLRTPSFFTPLPVRCLHYAFTVYRTCGSCPAFGLPRYTVGCYLLFVAACRSRLFGSVTFRGYCTRFVHCVRCRTAVMRLTLLHTTTVYIRGYRFATLQLTHGLPPASCHYRLRCGSHCLPPACAFTPRFVTVLHRAAALRLDHTFCHLPVRFGSAFTVWFTLYTYLLPLHGLYPHYTHFAPFGLPLWMRFTTLRFYPYVLRTCTFCTAHTGCCVLAVAHGCIHALPHTHSTLRSFTHGYRCYTGCLRTHRLPAVTFGLFLFGYRLFCHAVAWLRFVQFCGSSRSVARSGLRIFTARVRCTRLPRVLVLHTVYRLPCTCRAVTTRLRYHRTPVCYAAAWLHVYVRLRFVVRLPVTLPAVAHVGYVLQLPHVYSPHPLRLRCCIPRLLPVYPTVTTTTPPRLRLLPFLTYLLQFYGYLVTYRLRFAFPVAVYVGCARCTLLPHVYAFGYTVAHAAPLPDCRIRYLVTTFIPYRISGLRLPTYYGCGFLQFTHWLHCLVYAVYILRTFAGCRLQLPYTAVDFWLRTRVTVGSRLRGYRCTHIHTYLHNTLLRLPRPRFTARAVVTFLRLRCRHPRYVTTVLVTDFAGYVLL